MSTTPAAAERVVEIAGTTPRPGRRRRPVRRGSVLAQVGAVAWSVLCVVPFVLIVLLAFKSNADIYSKPLSVVGVDWNPANFADAWAGPPGGQGFASFLVNSFVVAVVALVVALAVGSATAYFATIAAPRVGRWVIRAHLVATVMPIIMLLIPYYSGFSALGLLSNPAALGVVYAALCLPTATLILHSFYLGFPPELRDAAAVDGLGPIATYWRIVLPLSRGPIVAVGMINGFFIWGETQVAIVLLQDPESRTIPVGLLGFQGQFSTNTGGIFAGVAIATIPVVVLYLVFHRSISKGIALGGVFR